MRIAYTRHALEKFKVLEKEGWNFSHKDIRKTIQYPYFSEFDKERNAHSALREMDKNHDLRVI